MDYDKIINTIKDNNTKEEEIKTRTMKIIEYMNSRLKIMKSYSNYKSYLDKIDEIINKSDYIVKNMEYGSSNFYVSICKLLEELQVLESSMIEEIGNESNNDDFLLQVIKLNNIKEQAILNKDREEYIRNIMAIKELDKKKLSNIEKIFILNNSLELAKISKSKNLEKEYYNKLVDVMNLIDQDKMSYMELIECEKYYLLNYDKIKDRKQSFYEARKQISKLKLLEERSLVEELCYFDFVREEAKVRKNVLMQQRCIKVINDILDNPTNEKEISLEMQKYLNINYNRTKSLSIGNILLIIFFVIMSLGLGVLIALFFTK